MSDTSTWQEDNARFLAAALNWVRFLLQRQATRESSHLQQPPPPPPTPSPVDPVVTPAEPSLLQRLFGQASADKPATATPAGLLLPASDQALDEQISAAAKAMDAAGAMTPSPALYILADRFALSRFERDVLLLCAALELDTSIASLCNLAQGSVNRAYPTFALALSLFNEPAWESLSPERPLRYWRLIEINQPGAQPLTTSALRIDERVLNYLKGLNYIDDRLTPFLVALQPPTSALPLPDSQQEAAAAIVRKLQLKRESTQLPVVQLPGSDSASKQFIAWHVATALGLHLYRLPAAWLPEHAAELDSLARFINRESALMPIAFYVDAAEIDKSSGDGSGNNRSAVLQRFLTRLNCLTFLETRDVRAFSTAHSITVDVAKPTRAEQRSAWEETLASSAVDSPAQLAGQFNLGLGDIDRIASTFNTNVPEDDARTPHQRLWDECLASTRPRLDELAQRLDPKATWADLVLPAQETNLLHQIAAQVSQRAKVYEEWGFSKKMNRGMGISALFAGDSGTGKTMAAEVIANELRLNLYRIDLSAVVSKYIGETEKNLRKLFDAAEDGGAILFFDEADALFGKRSEVKDSHDRYANIEINYLLQRLEAYRGLAILATNMKNALDAAFTRRLRFIVNFPFPGVAERREIWRDVFPPETHTKGLDVNRLARLNLTGGNIHNVALNAAFLAAKANKPVTMPFVFEAARAEFGKLDRLVSEADLYWPAETVEEELGVGEEAAA
ncbi:MAG TPA: ATP-binding protein [Pyrinomonadaceae bacterium]|nr:ATP-binding protein [Pyrinomonadaceae bacterium]